MYKGRRGGFVEGSPYDDVRHGFWVKYPYARNTMWLHGTCRTWMRDSCYSERDRTGYNTRPNQRPAYPALSNLSGDDHLIIVRSRSGCSWVPWRISRDERIGCVCWHFAARRALIGFRRFWLADGVFDWRVDWRAERRVGEDMLCRRWGLHTGCYGSVWTGGVDWVSWL